jgi:hypothetical protein
MWVIFFVKIRYLDDPFAYLIRGQMHVIECNLTGTLKLVLGVSMSNGKTEHWRVPFEKILEFFQNAHGHDFAGARTVMAGKPQWDGVNWDAGR